MAERLTQSAQRWIAPALREGATALDATAGTGADTRFLAAGVGATGRVHAWDCQRVALERAHRRLATAGLAYRVTWHLGCHSELERRLATVRIAAAMFNLGWLPRGPEGIITRPATTLAALERVAARLSPGGRLTILAYRGHAGGPEEQAAVAHWVANGAHGLTSAAPLAAGGDHVRPGPVLYRLQQPVGAFAAATPDNR